MAETECPECRHVHESKHCPECGAPAKGKRKPPPAPPAESSAVRKAIREEMTSVLDDRAKAREQRRRSKPRPWYETLKDEDGG